LLLQQRRTKHRAISAHRSCARHDVRLQLLTGGPARNRRTDAYRQSPNIRSCLMFDVLGTLTHRFMHRQLPQHPSICRSELYRSVPHGQGTFAASAATVAHRVLGLLAFHEYRSSHGPDCSATAIAASKISSRPERIPSNVG
jgi:hypothetical protein